MKKNFGNKNWMFPMPVLMIATYDENGRYMVGFIKARGVTTSVCHRTYVYQDGKLLYTNR